MSQLIVGNPLEPQYEECKRKLLNLEQTQQEVLKDLHLQHEQLESFHSRQLLIDQCLLQTNTIIDEMTQSLFQRNWRLFTRFLTYYLQLMKQQFQLIFNTPSLIPILLRGTSSSRASLMKKPQGKSELNLFSVTILPFQEPLYCSTSYDSEWQVYGTVESLDCNNSQQQQYEVSFARPYRTPLQNDHIQIVRFSSLEQDQDQQRDKGHQKQFTDPILPSYLSSNQGAFIVDLGIEKLPIIVSVQDIPDLLSIHARQLKVLQQSNQYFEELTQKVRELHYFSEDISISLTQDLALLSKSTTNLTTTSTTCTSLSRQIHKA